MIKAMVCGVALLTAVGPVLAQETGAIERRAPIFESIPDIAAEPAPKVRDFLVGQVPGQLLSSDLVGMKLYGVASDVLGTIDDVLFDKKGVLSGVVVDVGAYLGTEKRIAFALDNLRYEVGENDLRLVASIDRAMLKAAPEFRSLSDEMERGDAQSLTSGESEPAEVEQSVPAR